MATKNADLAAKVAELEQRLAFVEQHGSPALKQALKTAEQDRHWFAAQAIADIADDAERAAALLAADHETRREFWERVSGDPGKAYDTARLLPAGQRAAIVAMAPPSLQNEMVVFCLPVPERVRVKLAPGVTSWSSPPIKGATPRDDYRGVRLADGRSSEPGAAERIYTVALFDRMLEIDADLAAAIERGVVVVTPVSEDESRSMLAAEIAELNPAERPRIRW